MTADLHLHTLHSDGSWSPEEVVQAAVQHGFKTIAITDHDTVAGIAAAQTRGAALGIEVIPGIEINSVYATSDGAYLDVHVLGYFIDVNCDQLHQVMQRQQEARHRLVRDTIERCNKVGIPLTIEHVQQCSGNGSIGRPHLARAIVKAGGAADVEKAFMRFMSRESNEFIPRNSVSPQEAIAAIQAAGGLSSIAHPGKSESMERVILDLKQVGLQGVESYHRSYSLKTVKHNLRLAAQHGLLVTGGSDCHGPSDGYPASIGSVKVPMDVVNNLRHFLQAQSKNSSNITRKSYPAFYV
jgi:3',5'-nucleoside bisphosphate phosphatase